jgi:hypothetical protein
MERLGPPVVGAAKPSPGLTPARNFSGRTRD